MKIDVNILKQLVSAIFLKFEEDGISSLEVDEDFYWHIPRDKIYNPYEEPKTEDLSLGQLSDDWETLHAAVISGAEIEYGSLIKLSSLLRNLGEKVIFVDMKDDEDSS